MGVFIINYNRWVFYQLKERHDKLTQKFYYEYKKDKKNRSRLNTIFDIGSIRWVACMEWYFQHLHVKR